MNRAAAQLSKPVTLPPRYVVLGMAIILCVVSYVLWAWYFPCSGGGVDEATYLLAAKQIALHGDPVYQSADPQLFVPEMMVETRPGIFYPVYPIGYPLLAAVGYKIGGPEGAFVVNPVLTIVALFGVFFLARLLLDDLFALAAVMLMGLHPTVLYYGTAAWSHAADLAFSTWCLYFALAWYRKPAAYKLALAGFLASYAVSIRYTEALLALPLGYLVLLRFLESWRKRPKAAPAVSRVLLHVVIASVAGIVALVPLLWFHAHAFGSLWRTGYSLTGQSHAFSLGYFFNNFPFALWTLCSVPVGLFIFFPVSLVSLFVRRWMPRAMAGFLALAIVPTVLLYGAYYWANHVEPTMYARFFLTLFPLVFIAALVPADLLTRHRTIVRYGLVGALVVLASVVLGEAPNQNAIATSAYSDLAATRLIQKNLPPDAVVMGNGYMNYSFIYYTDMTVVYPVYFSESWVKDRLASEQGHGAALDFNPLRMERFRQQFAGRTQEELYAMLEQKLLAYARAGRTVALVVQRDDPQWFAYLSRSFSPEIVATDNENKLLLIVLRPQGKDAVATDKAGV